MIKETKQKGLEYLYHDGELYALVIRAEYDAKDITFFTPQTFSQQLGYLPHKKGNIIKPHRHTIAKREILYTQEVLFIKKGKVEINFYDPTHKHVGTETVAVGDVILLCGGGHGFKMLEEAIMIEVKQGPYTGTDDKVRFDGVECK